MELKDLRSQINSIDDEIVRLFCQRMDVAAAVAAYKKENMLPIFVPARELEILSDVALKSGPEFADYTQILYSTIFELSRSYQTQKILPPTPLCEKVMDAVNQHYHHLPQTTVIACLEEESIKTSVTSARLFQHATIQFYKTEKEVITAVRNNFCTYGLLPLENPGTGIINTTLDILSENDFSIARVYREPNDHRWAYISKDLKIDSNADRTSIMMSLPNQPGTLYKVLARMYALGINISAFFSRSVSKDTNRLMVYFELEITTVSDIFYQFLCGLDELCSEYRYLGSYCEVTQ